MHIEKPQAVLLDLDHTFYDYEQAHVPAQEAVVTKAIKSLGLSKENFNEAYQQARQETKARLKGQAACHSRLLYWQRTLELLKMKTQAFIALDLEQTYWHHFLVNIHLFPDAIAFLQELKIHHIPAAFVTDLTTQIQLRKLVYLKLDGLIDYVVSSEEAGAEKPSPKPFELALQKLSLGHDSVIWMIGDSLINDIMGAKQALQAVTFWRRHAIAETSTVLADVSFNHFEELISIIRGLYKDGNA